MFDKIRDKWMNIGLKKLNILSPSQNLKYINENTNYRIYGIYFKKSNRKKLLEDNNISEIYGIDNVDLLLNQINTITIKLIYQIIIR